MGVIFPFSQTKYQLIFLYPVVPNPVPVVTIPPAAPAAPAATMAVAVAVAVATAILSSIISSHEITDINSN